MKHTRMKSTTPNSTTNKIKVNTTTNMTETLNTTTATNTNMSYQIQQNNTTIIGITNPYNIQLIYKNNSQNSLTYTSIHTHIHTNACHSYIVTIAAILHEASRVSNTLKTYSH